MKTDFFIIYQIWTVFGFTSNCLEIHYLYTNMNSFWIVACYIYIQIYSPIMKWDIQFFQNCLPAERRSLALGGDFESCPDCVYIYIYEYLCVYIYVLIEYLHIYIYIYIVSTSTKCVQFFEKHFNNKHVVDIYIYMWAENRWYGFRSKHLKQHDYIYIYA